MILDLRLTVFVVFGILMAIMFIVALLDGGIDNG